MEQGCCSGSLSWAFSASSSLVMEEEELRAAGTEQTARPTLGEGVGGGKGTATKSILGRNLLYFYPTPNSTCFPGEPRASSKGSCPDNYRAAAPALTQGLKTARAARPPRGTGHLLAAAPGVFLVSPQSCRLPDSTPTAPPNHRGKSASKVPRCPPALGALSPGSQPPGHRGQRGLGSPIWHMAVGARDCLICSGQANLSAGHPTGGSCWQCPKRGQGTHKDSSYRGDTSRSSLLAHRQHCQQLQAPHVGRALPLCHERWALLRHLSSRSPSRQLNLGSEPPKSLSGRASQLPSSESAPLELFRKRVAGELRCVLVVELSLLG